MASVYLLATSAWMQPALWRRLKKLRKLVAAVGVWRVGNFPGYMLEVVHEGIDPDKAKTLKKIICGCKGREET